MSLFQKHGLFVTCDINHSPRKSLYAVYLGSLEIIMMWESGTEPCQKISWDEQRSTMLTRNRIMQSLSCKTKALHKPFWLFWQHVGLPRIFLLLHRRKVQSQPWTRISHVCKSQLTSPVLSWRFSFSSLLYSLPKTITHGFYYQVLPAQFPQSVS